MIDKSAGLKRLTQSHALPQQTPAVPRPPRNWKSRVMLPATILTAGVATLAYSARAALLPTLDVWVLPVIARPALAGESTTPQPTTAKDSTSTTAVAQAPGWVEADPYPVTIPALAEGVVQTVLIVEGQHVEAGQVVVRMIDADARLAAGSAAAELASQEAELQRARANLEYQKINYDRILRLHNAANAPDIEMAGGKREYDQAEAGLHDAEARVLRHKVICEQANLTLSRMEIRSPISGIVMARLVEPGTRISMSNISSGERMGAVARLYDPKKLQVRVDVPLGDAWKVDVGSRAEIMTEAAPDAIFHGTVSRVVHEANIQRNTVQFKVAIADPSPMLKPEMLTRVRFFDRGAPADKAAKAEPPSAVQLLAPHAALVNISGDQADAWSVENRSEGPVASLLRIKFAGPERDGYCPVIDGAKPGMRLIVNPPDAIRAGARLRVLGEKTNSVKHA